jgi:hypothetical protein
MPDKDNDTKEGAMDDNATARAKKNKESKEKQLKAIFDDNTSGRYSGPTDD